MVKYLQMNGLGDYLQLSDITVDVIEMEILLDETQPKLYPYIFGVYDNGASASRGVYTYNNSTNLASNLSVTPNLFVNDVSSTTLQKGTKNKFKIDLVQNTNLSNGRVFWRSSGNDYVKGNIYSVKLFLDGVIVAHYDMSTGTVQDQSGNGNHATLTGGTWLDDGTGGDVGTEVISSYASKQSIYQAAVSSYDSKQSIYMTQYEEFASKVIQYKTDASDYQTKQTISKDIDTFYSTSQVITLVGGREVTTLFPTKQQIYLVRRSDFDTQQAIKGRFYKTLNLSMSTRSEVKLSTTLEDTMIEVVSYIGQTVYQPNPLRTVSEMEVIA